jgi:RNA polymerase sigma-70 factor (ECF subfamily)
MTQEPGTRPSLLLRLRDPRDAGAWAELIDLYGPLLFRLARRHGLQEADAADLTQEVLQRVAGAIGGFAYDPSRSFRSWLRTIALNRLRDWRQAAAAARRGGGGEVAGGNSDLFEQVPAPPADDEGEWERDYQRQVLLAASRRVEGDFSATTWQAFQLTAVEGLSGPEAAARLGMSLGAVHVARSRVTARLRETVRQMMLDEEMTPLPGGR